MGVHMHVHRGKFYMCAWVNMHACVYLYICSWVSVYVHVHMHYMCTCVCVHVVQVHVYARMTKYFIYICMLCSNFLSYSLRPQKF